MLQLKNTTPFAVDISVLSDEEGIESLYVNVAARFKIGAEWTLAENQSKPRKEDEYWGEPESSSLKSASDIHLGKPSTDIIMLGHACAPELQPVRRLDVRLAVGNKSKVVRVFGDRVWTKEGMTRPEAFTQMPLVYERAYGGSYVNDAPEPPVVTSEERNPVGKGFAGGRDQAEMDGQALPNLEDPNHLIRSVDDNPEPACFAFRAPYWQPRTSYAGTYDEQWQQERAPYMPQDFNPRFFNAAHPDLICDGYLQGGETVEISHMHPKGDLRFSLPHVKLKARFDSDDESVTAPFNLETLLLEPNDLTVSMGWKAKYRCDKKTLKMRQVVVALSR